MVARLSEEIRIVLDPIVGNQIAAPHRLGTVGNPIHPSYPDRSSWSANSGIVETVGVAKSLLRQLINRRCAGIGPSIATHPRHPIVLAGNPENVRALLLSETAQLGEEYNQNQSDSCQARRRVKLHVRSVVNVIPRRK